MNLFSPFLERVITQGWASCLNNYFSPLRGLSSCSGDGASNWSALCLSTNPHVTATVHCFNLHPFITHGPAHCGLNMWALKSHPSWSAGKLVTAEHLQRSARGNPSYLHWKEHQKSRGESKQNEGGAPVKRVPSPLHHFGGLFHFFLIFS